MAKYKVKKSLLNGQMSVPPSKSQTMRAILFASLAEGKSTVMQPLLSNDTFKMISACQHFGAKITLCENRLEIEGVAGKIQSTEDVIDAGNSGLILRLCTGIASLGKYPMVITGDHSIRHQRPMQPLVEGLRQLGVEVQSMRGDDYAPLIIKGPLKSGKAIIKGIDSQYVSALLIAASISQGSIELFVEEPGEKPWVALTISWLEKMGVSIKNDNFSYYFIKGNSKFSAFNYTVPADLSNAAFPIVAALMTGSTLNLINIDIDDLQGDKEFIFCLIKMGANIEIDRINKSLHVFPTQKLKGIEIDINNFIDAVTIFSVVACLCEGETLLRNVTVAKFKECNRIASIICELKKMGAHILETEDGILIKKSKLIGTTVSSYGDHRMAMSLAVAGMYADGETVIEDVECIQKTFPNFLQVFQQCRANIEEVA